MVNSNSPLIRLAIYWGVSFGGGTLDSHDGRDRLVGIFGGPTAPFFFGFSDVSPRSFEAIFVGRFLSKHGWLNQQLYDTPRSTPFIRGEITINNPLILTIDPSTSWDIQVGFMAL